MHEILANSIHLFTNELRHGLFRHFVSSPHCLKPCVHLTSKFMAGLFRMHGTAAEVTFTSFVKLTSAVKEASSIVVVSHDTACKWTTNKQTDAHLKSGPLSRLLALLFPSKPRNTGQDKRLYSARRTSQAPVSVNVEKTIFRAGV